MGEIQLPITQQRVGKLESFDRFKLIIRVLGAQSEQVRRPCAGQFAKVISEGAALRGATPGARHGIPSGRNRLIRLSGSRITKEDRPAVNRS